MIKGNGRKKRLKLTTCQYTDEVTDLLVRRIRQIPQYSDCKVTSMGPFGLGATCSVSVRRNEKLLGFLTVGYETGSGKDFGNFNYVDYSVPSKKIYPDGSIGDMNGFNNVTHPLPTEIEKVLQLVFKSVMAE